MRKSLFYLFAVLLLIIPACKPPLPYSGLTDDKTYRLDLITEIKAFEKKLGFNETDNFKAYSDETEAYDYYFYTYSTELPYSTDDPLLKSATGKPETASVDFKIYDVFFYSIDAIAGIKTPVTKSLLQAPLPRFIHIIFHEDWHEQIDSPLGIEEPCAEVISYVAAMLFTEEKFGKDSVVYRTLKDEFTKTLRESKLYQRYYEELNVLYSQFHSGEMLRTETLSKKAELLESMGNDLKDIWGGRPDQLNNAFIAFQMTYSRHFPLMHQVFSATNFDLEKTMAIFLSVPDQGAEFKDVEELKRIETKVIDYLHDTLSKTLIVDFQTVEGLVQSLYLK
ncbi:hypothetical protein ACFL4C_01720 [Candidatus Omnitrophota bacterium]